MFQDPLMLQTRIKNRPIRCGIVILALLAVLLGIPVAAAQTFGEAGAAYKRGDYATAMEGFRVHAEQGDALAQFVLGSMYAEGKGVPENAAEAVKWFRKAAEQGDANAQEILGFMYDHGEGVTENDAEAVKWFRKAAEQGHANAQLRLGGMYFVGEGVPEDYVLAYAWHNLAAAQGNKAAAEIKDSLRPLMTAAQIAQAQELSATLVLTR